MQPKLIQDGGIKRKKHRRCPKKDVSEAKLQETALNSYLTSIDITWSSFQKFHSRLGPQLQVLIVLGVFCFQHRNAIKNNIEGSRHYLHDSGVGHHINEPGKCPYKPPKQFMNN